MTDQPRVSSKDIWLGIGLTVLLHLFILFVPIAAFAIGVVQLFYIVPAIVIFYKKKRIGIVQGLLIGAAVTFLLNAACFGIFMGKM